MTEDTPANKSGIQARFKVMLTAALFIAAGVVTYYRLAGDADATVQLAAELGDATYDVRCGGCNESSTMPAREYLRQTAALPRGAGGIVCPRCGASKAWRAESFTIPDQNAGEPEADYEERAWGALGRSRLKPGVTLDPPTVSETTGDLGD